MLSSHLTDAPLSPHSTRDMKVGISLGVCWSNLLSCSEFIPILFLSPQHLSCFHDTLDSVTNICCILFVLSPFPRGRSVWNIKFCWPNFILCLVLTCLGLVCVSLQWFLHVHAKEAGKRKMLGASSRGRDVFNNSVTFLEWIPCWVTGEVRLS